MTHYPIVMQQGNNIYSFFLEHTYIHTDRHTFAFIYKNIIVSSILSVFVSGNEPALEQIKVPLCDESLWCAR
jgi:hypothetical protein